MDEQHPLFPSPSYGADPQPERQPTRPRLGRRTIATVASTALVAGLVGVGGGFVAGHRFGGSSTAASGQENAAANGQGGTSGGGRQAIPGNPGWTWTPNGQSQVPVPSDPFGEGGGSAQGQSSGTTTKANATQLSGLVRVVSTMKYAGAKAAGTGLVLTSDGEVVTNHHVVEGATSVKVTVMSTGTSYTASVVGTDAKDDVAVLQLDNASGLSTVKTDTQGISVGDAVTAVGDGNGTVHYLSAAKGKVLALQQSITTQSEGTASGERLTGLTKISSDVVSGYSGGATYDSQGEVVGMTTAASSGGSDVVGYAVPIDTVTRIAADLENGVSGVRYDYGRPAFLGVGLGNTSPTVQGVYSGTPAANAGLAAGDTITAVDATKVATSDAVHKAIATHSPGDSVSVTWATTSGATRTATVTLVQGPVA